MRSRCDCSLGRQLAEDVRYAFGLDPSDIDRLTSNKSLGERDDLLAGEEADERDHRRCR